jgi:hypothetical protein
MDAADLELFERSLAHALAEHEGAALDDALAEHEGAALDDALAELGWFDALELEPRTAVASLFELQGSTPATSGALDAVLAAAGGLEAGSSVVLPSAGSWAAPGALADGILVVEGLAGAGFDDRGELWVPTRDEAEAHVAIRVPAGALSSQRVEGMDPSLRLRRITGTVELAGIDVEPRALDFDALVARGRLALSHELIGASRAMLELARTHALERIQFGVPISSFQAVRHRLADALVATESASSVLLAAWGEESGFAAQLAKAYAGRSARLAAGHCQQVLAGMGFTAEHRYHRYFRRVLVVEQLFGASAQLTRAMGAELLERGGLPALFPL